MALGQARTRVSALFGGLTTAAQNWHPDLPGDWGALKCRGANLKSGQAAWPDNDEAMCKEAKKRLETSLLKDLAKVRWNPMRACHASTHDTRELRAPPPHRVTWSRL